MITQLCDINQSCIPSGHFLTFLCILWSQFTVFLEFSGTYLPFMQIINFMPKDMRQQTEKDSFGIHAWWLRQLLKQTHSTQLLADCQSGGLGDEFYSIRSCRQVIIELGSLIGIILYGPLDAQQSFEGIEPLYIFLKIFKNDF